MHTVVALGTVLILAGCAEPHHRSEALRDGGDAPSAMVRDTPPVVDASADAATELEDAALADAESAKDAETDAAADAAGEPVNAGASCVPSAETCDGKDNDCDGKVDDGLTNACMGSECSADVSKLNQACSVVEGECNGMGTWACDATKGNNALTCAVSKRSPVNLVKDPGFELQQSYSVSAPWQNFKGAFVSSDAHSGSKGVTILCDTQTSTSVSAWNDSFTTISVTPNTYYKLEAWVKTSPNFVYGRLGARATDGTAKDYAEGLGYIISTPLSQWTYVATRFKADATEVGIYMGGQDNNGAQTSLSVDDVSVTREMFCL